MIIAAAALVGALVVAGRGSLPTRYLSVPMIAVLAGFAYTVFSERMNVGVRGTWGYSELMPVVSLFGWKIGVSPLAQWLVVPTIAFTIARRMAPKPTQAEPS